MKPHTRLLIGIAAGLVAYACVTNPVKPVAAGVGLGGGVALAAGGPVGVAVGLALGTATTWILTDAEAAHAVSNALGHPPPPWYLDGWVWAKLALGIAFLWFVLKYLLGQRYRESVNAGISALVKGRLPTAVKHLWTAAGAKHTEKK